MKEEVKKDKVGKYIETVGRRKTSVARVRITEASKNSITVNNREFENYFTTKELRNTVNEPISKLKIGIKFNITAKLDGGGINSQSEALRLGISRALIIYNIEYRKKLKQLGFLKRDPRAKERRKFGLKKARKAPQWSKR